MKLYDISQEVFSCKVYPGDPAPKKEMLFSMEHGDLYNLTAFSMCAHNGTHIDAPRHFLADGTSVEGVALSKTVGFAYVAECQGLVTAADAARGLEAAQKEHTQAAKKILIKGDAVISSEAAEVFATGGVELLGVESQSVGPENAPMAAHLALLLQDAVLLEGIRLGAVPAGVYFLFAAPLSLAGADGAPCRAILMEIESFFA